MRRDHRAVVYVDLNANGYFATNHPNDYQDLIANTPILMSKIPVAAAGLGYLSTAHV
jgi:hypothetical protein